MSTSLPQPNKGNKISFMGFGTNKKLKKFKPTNNEYVFSWVKF